jgi:serine/threonine protein kinase
MAPEQAREAARIDARADLYSLGCVLYEMLVGQPPFVAEGAGEIIAMQMFTEPDPPATRAPVSAALDQLVMRLLAKEPADRPQTAAEVRQLLGGRISEPIIDTPTAPAAPITPMPVIRSTMLPFVLAGIAVLLVGGAALVATRSEETVTKPPAVVEPRPLESPAPIVESKPDVPEVAPVPAPVPAKKKPAVKSARIAKPAARADQKLKTDNNSPFEVDVGQLRPPKAP